MKSTRHIKISCRCNGQNAVNIGIPSSSVWKLVRKHGGEEIWRSMDACPLNPVGAVSITGNLVRLSRSSSMKLCGKPTVSTVDALAVLALRDVAWHLIDPGKTDAIREEVERKYLTTFPEMRGKYSFPSVRECGRRRA